MKANEHVVLIGSKVVLVPYLPEHVPKYHDWMQDEELQRLTASEPLSIEEEYEMQQKWRLDEDKLTFIILSLESLSGEQILRDLPSNLSPTDETIRSLPMVGDVNMFLKGEIPTSETAAASKSNAGVSGEDDEDAEEFEAEMEIMIAEPGYRRKGLALEALQLMLEYATGYPRSYFSDTSAVLSNPSSKGLGIPPSSLLARIGDANAPSIKLFEMLGFRITRRVEVFEEVEMRFRPPNCLVNKNFQP
ncbi:hypothetical protein H0H92_014016 [Tricholoma furcatifolium]|nr:hypothetical protein H0H92_014016 [Tricholoma furcatifolium]